MGDERGRLYNKAGGAYSAGDYRKCADFYRKSYEAVKQNGRTFQPLDYCSLHGFTALLRYEEIPIPSAEDLAFLKAVGNDANASALVRMTALFTTGFLRRNQGDREGAARYYRKALQVADSASPAERARKEAMPGGSGWQDVNVGARIATLREETRTNLGVLEGILPNSACGPNAKVNMLGVPVGPGGSSRDAAAAEKLLQQLSISGSACDHCGREPAASEPRLLTCSGCRAAWYCDRTCQVAARPAHKAECGPLKEGQRVMLKGLEKQPQLNGTVVELQGFVEDSQRWEVSIIGGDKTLRVKEQNLQRMRVAAKPREHTKSSSTADHPENKKG